MNDYFDSKVKLGVLACIGGFVTGFASMAAINRLARQKYEHTENIQERFDNLLYKEIDFRQREVTTFSDITGLVGSVSDNDTIDNADDTIDNDSTRESVHFDIMRNYPNTSDNRTLMAKYMTPEIYEAYCNVETSYGFTFDNAIQSGIDVPHFPNCGFIAGDEETFDVFAEFIDPILSEKHSGFRRDVHCHNKCLDQTKLAANYSLLDANYVEQISFTAGRSVSGYRFLPSCSRADRRELEEKFRNVFENISTGNNEIFDGEYYPLEKKNEEILNNLPPDTPFYWVEKPSASVYVNAGVTRDWPDARGIFISRCGNVFISVNRDDHLRIFCRETEADMLKLFKKFCHLHRVIEEKMADEGIRFSYHNIYGFLHWYPSVIGTGLKICIRIRLQHLAGHCRLFEIMKRLRLRFSFSSEPEKAQKGIMEIYNGDRLGFSEVELTELLVSGAQKLIEIEKQLETCLPIDGMIPKQKGTPMLSKRSLD